MGQEGSKEQYSQAEVFSGYGRGCLSDICHLRLGRNEKIARRIRSREAPRGTIYKCKIVSHHILVHVLMSIRTSVIRELLGGDMSILDSLNAIEKHAVLSQHGFVLRDNKFFKVHITELCNLLPTKGNEQSIIDRVEGFAEFPCHIDCEGDIDHPSSKYADIFIDVDRDKGYDLSLSQSLVEDHLAKLIIHNTQE